MKLKFDPILNGILATETDPVDQEQSNTPQHDCRKCEAFDICLPVAGTGTIAKCIWWHELEEIAKQM